MLSEYLVTGLLIYLGTLISPTFQSRQRRDGQIYYVLLYIILGTTFVCFDTVLSICIKYSGSW